ncbi:hypothetical protein FRB94_009876, partial [Tulasnella sp. JGI-2019a]
MMKSTLAFLFLHVVLLAAPASASGCSGCPFPCGRVENLTDRDMLYTTDPNPNLGAHHDRCRFWNWYTTWPWSTERREVPCTQKPLPRGSSSGGCSSEIDVDAYTFAYNDYYAGGTLVRTAEWTKIPDTKTATCRK